MLRKHVFLACFAIFVMATLVLANAYRAKAEMLPPAPPSAVRIDAQTTPTALYSDPLPAKGRKTECGL